ncbi:MAG: ATP-dependent helicase [Deltaproteobacteria bacterium]|jgi:DNA helicase-2/ATP-dependent DNA helicase PcrA|nr:ATP-dependent helicase [Deltaproteobacteria bacterium]
MNTASSMGLDLKSVLNEAQERAATHPGGPLLIIAGAGSGKTRTLVYRVAHLIDRGFDPKRLLLVTFTRKAAAEMLERCASLVGSHADRVCGGTFHSLANGLLRRYARNLGYTPGFGIMDRSDSETLITRIRKQVGSDSDRLPKKGTLMTLISQAVNHEIDIDELIVSRHRHLIDSKEAICEIAKSYQDQKLACDLMDFDDLLVNLEKLLSQNEHIRSEVASRFDYVLVDEYQDTNPIQARLTHLLGRDHQNVTAVGDEAQSIYSFRGADFHNIMNFPNLFPQTTILRLEDNYRSRPEVLSVANHLLAQARESFKKTLNPNRQSGPKPRIYITYSLKEEAQLILYNIQALLTQGVTLSNIAVLFRASNHSFELETLLIKENIPFSKFGGRKFLEIAQVKDFSAILRLIVNPQDTVSLSRVLGLLNGFGARSIEKVRKWLDVNPGDLKNMDKAPLSPKAKMSLGPLIELISEASGLIGSPELLAKIIYDYYLGIIKNIYPDDFNSRLDEIHEFKRMLSQADDIVNFLADITIDPPNTVVKGRAIEDKRPDLTLSTIHSAKGLEWNHVFVISVIDGRFPSIYSLNTPQTADEELRLMYVAVTRAKDELTITMPMDPKFTTGPVATPPSMFFASIPPDDVEVYKDGTIASPQALNPGYRHHEPQKDYQEDNEHYYGVEPPKPKQPAPKPISLGRPVDKPLRGLVVHHPTYGNGKIISVKNQNVLIHFDLVGLKNVMIPYAKLTHVDS